MAQVQTHIREELTKAMKARKEPDLTVLRGILGAFTNELVALKRTPQAELTDEEALTVIRRAVKQRKDSIEQFEKANRMELVENEKAELQVLEAYLPQMMSVDAVTAIAIAKKNEMGINDKGQAGILMAALMKELRGKADGAVVKEVVTHLLG